ncbi:MAG: DUF805 domain-containing protein [Akkermansia sp.]|nr:DUF805 domain-containing protein [Akkermansia sp.]
MNYYYLNSCRQPVGPLTEEQLKSAIRTEALLPETPVVPEENSEWVPLSSLPEMAEELAIIENSSMGACPNCGKDITGFIMPANCPHCGYEMALPPEDRANLWKNFVFSMKKSFTLRGRATRMEYWSFVLFENIILYILSGIVTLLMPLVSMLYASPMEDFDLSGLIVLLVVVLVPTALMMIPYVSVSVRRLHDIGASGVWIPGGILSFLTPLFAFFLLEPGTTAFAVAYALLCLIPIGVSFRIIISHFQDTQRGGNAYGPSSKYPR